MDREKNLPKFIYFSDSYFKMEQLYSYAHQINAIHSLRPNSLLEIGIGNGFTSTFFRKLGYDVVTVDINHELCPDICLPINELNSSIFGRTFDLIVCCEVLEHIPFCEFEGSIKTFASIGKNLFLTLPNYKRQFGFGGVLRLPKLSIRISKYFEIKYKKEFGSGHFWEVDSSKNTNKRSVVSILEKYYNSVEISRFALSPYHISFTAKR